MTDPFSPHSLTASAVGRMLEQKALSARVDFLATAASNFPQEGAATLRAAADKMEGK